jgi:hypothetical protein
MENQTRTEVRGLRELAMLIIALAADRTLLKEYARAGTLGKGFKLWRSQLRKRHLQIRYKAVLTELQMAERSIDAIEREINWMYQLHSQSLHFAYAPMVVLRLVNADDPSLSTNSNILTGCYCWTLQLVTGIIAEVLLLWRFILYHKHGLPKSKLKWNRQAELAIEVFLKVHGQIVDETEAKPKR